MKRTLLALVAVLLAVSLARADYIVIIANLSPNATGSGNTGGGGMIGGPPGPGGMLGGPPGAGGMIGRPGGGLGGMIGGPPGPGGGIGRPGGMFGGPPPGAGGMIGGVPGSPIGGMPGSPSGPPADQDDDEIATLVVTVLEVNTTKAKDFEAGQAVWFTHRWGRAVLQKKMGTYEVSAVTLSGKPMPTVSERFRRDYDRVFRDTPKPEAMLALARKALEYGLLTRFTEVMDKLAEVNKDSPVVKKYLAVKAELAKKAPVSDGATTWKGRLLEGYRVAQKDDSHFALIHNQASDDTPEVKAHLARLERTFRGFYYWWALHKDGGPLTLPKERLVAVLAETGEDFNKLKRVLSSGPMVSDSFHARREGLSVFARRRSDEAYTRFEATTRRYWEDRFDPVKILSGKTGVGYPRDKRPDEAHYARAAALVLRSLEHEWETNASSHEVARQLLFATGLLAPKVHAPEWVQFGVGSMFEAPLQSPIHGFGVPNSYYLPRFREFDKSGKYGDTKTSAGRLETLLQVITDGIFHQPPKKGRDGKDEPKDAVQRRARAAAWSLTYFLAQHNLNGLKQYFRELSKLPRDVDPGPAVLEAAFARAFRCVDATTGRPNRAMLQVLANSWFSYARSVPLEGKEIHDQIRKAYATIRRSPSGGTSGPGGPGFPGGPGGPPRPGGPGGPPRPGGR